MTFSHFKAKRSLKFLFKFSFFLSFCKKSAQSKLLICCDSFVVICLGYVRAFNIHVKVLFMII